MINSQYINPWKEYNIKDNYISLETFILSKFINIKRKRKNIILQYYILFKINIYSKSINFFFKKKNLKILLA